MLTKRSSYNALKRHLKLYMMKLGQYSFCTGIWQAQDQTNVSYLTQATIFVSLRTCRHCSSLRGYYISFLHHVLVRKESQKQNKQKATDLCTAAEELE